MSNKNLNQAKIAKNDEFYTQLSDIEKELKHYKSHFENKVVYCNCDDPRWSNFWVYFHLNFSELKLKKLIATFYKIDITSDEKVFAGIYEGGNDNDCSVYRREELQYDGSCFSDEVKPYLDEYDIVVTNGPFSLFRDFIKLLMDNNKKFLIICSMNALSNKEFFPLIKNNRVWLGTTLVKEFKEPNGNIKKFGNICWFTNLDHQKRHEKLILWKAYSPEDYPKYDNYDAINVNKLTDIPADYKGTMGVPISFLDKFNPEQFQILGNEYTLNLEKGRGYVKGKRLYARIFIQAL